MIKSLLEPDEYQPEKIKTETEEKTTADLTVDENFESHFADIELPPSETDAPENLLEISESADNAHIFSERPEETPTVQSPSKKTGEAFDFSEPHFNQPENSFAETISYESLDETTDERTNDELLAGFPVDELNFELPAETAFEKPTIESAAEISNETASPEPLTPTAGETTNFETPIEAKVEKPQYENSGLLFQTPAEPESFAETARKSGLAYAAAITLFGSIVFMLIIGWFADLLLGSSPWGIVGGILLGAAIGFFQFFRLTSQIFKDRD